MNEDKQLIIHFNNGTKMEVSFPTQIKNSPGALLEGAKRILEGDKLVIQTEQQLVIIPWSSVQFLEGASVPAAALPFPRLDADGNPLPPGAVRLGTARYRVAHDSRWDTVFSPAGDRVAFVTRTSVIVHDLTTGRRAYELADPARFKPYPKPHGDTRVSRAAFTPDGPSYEAASPAASDRRPAPVRRSRHGEALRGDQRTSPQRGSRCGLESELMT